MIRAAFASTHWLKTAEVYLCAELDYMAPLVPVHLGPVDVTGGVGYHHVSVYRCHVNGAARSWSGPCESPTPRGCEEMLFTYTSSAPASLPPRDVSFLPSKRLVVQLHTRREAMLWEGPVSVSIPATLAPSHIPVVQFVEIGARRDWGGARLHVEGRCPPSCRHMRPSRVHYLILHSHHPEDRNCISTPTLSSCGFARNAVARVDLDVGARDDVRLSCTFARPASLGTNSTDQMCFAYALVDRTSESPYHCWSSDTEETCH